MRKTIISIFAAIALIATSCNNNSEGELLKSSTEEYVKNKVQYSTELNGKRIAIEGYVTFSTADIEGDMAEIELSDKPIKGGATLISFEIKEGTSKNSISFGETSNARNGGYRTTVSDVEFDKVKIYDNEGNAHPLTQKIRLSGDLSYVKGMDGNFTSMAAFDKGKTQYNPEFKNVRVDAVK